MTWQYIAGFFDGDGTVGLYHSKALRYGGTGYINARLTQRQPHILRLIQGFLAARGIRTMIRNYPYSQLSSRPQSALEIHRSSIPAFLVGVLPHLVVKKTLVQDILRYKILFPPFTPKMRGQLAMETRWRNRAQAT
jgi:hypothetical protein